MYKSKTILLLLFACFALALTAQTLTLSVDSGKQISAASIGQGAVKQPIMHFRLSKSSSSYNQYLTGVSFTTAGSYSAASILRYQLWTNDSDNLDAATQLGTDITNSMGTGSHSFSGFNQYFNSSQQRYYWITMDVSPTASLGNYLNVAALSSGNISRSGGSVSGSADAAGRQTIVFASRINDYFRSKQSGYWDELSSWQSSHDNVNWYDATLLPSEDANLSIIAADHIITLRDSHSICNLDIHGTLITGSHQLCVDNLDNYGTIRAARKTILLSGQLNNKPGSTIDYTAPISIPASNDFYCTLILSAEGLYYLDGVVSGISQLDIPSENTYLYTRGQTLEYGSKTGDGHIITGGSMACVTTLDPASETEYIIAHSYKNPIYNFILTSSEEKALTGFKFYVTTSELGSDYIDKYELYYSDEEDFNSATLLSTIPQDWIDDNWEDDSQALVFPEFEAVLDANTHYYFWISLDAANFDKPDYPEQISLKVNALSADELDFESDSIVITSYDGAIQYFLPTTFTISSNNPAVEAAEINRGSVKNPIYEFTLSTPCTKCVAYLTGLSFTTAGTHTTNDITRLQLWANSNNDLSSATLLATQNYTNTGSNSFSGFSYHLQKQQVLNYVWITADVASDAGTSRNISVNAITTNDIGLSSGNLTGSTSNGGTQTFASAIYHYRSKQSGYWGTEAIWERSVNGVDSWQSFTNSNQTPTSSHATITIRAGHTVTVAASVTVDQVLVEAGGTVVVNSSRTLTIANGAEAVDMHVKGVLKSQGTITANGTLLIDNGGVYEHAHTNPSSGVPPFATWGDGSLLKITGFSTNANIPQDAAWNQSFYDVEYNCTGQRNYRINLNFQNFTKIRNDLIINSTANGSISFAEDGTGETKNIGGSLIINSGTVDIAATSGDYVLQLGADLVINSPGKLQVGGSGNGKITFRSGGEHNVNVYSGGMTTGKITVEVKNNSQVNLGTSVLGGGGGFSLEAGSSLETAHPSGLNGNITMSGTKTLSSDANYIFDGSTAQVTGGLLPSSVNNITINNSSNTGVTLSNNLTVNGTMTMTEGNLSLGSRSLSYGNNANLVYNGAHPQSSGPEWLNNMSRPVSIRNTSSEGLSLSGNKTNSSTVTVHNGAVFDMQDNSIGGSGSFTLRDDATLISSHPQGVDSIDTSGGITLSQNATYVFNGNTAQQTGNNIPPVVKDLVIDNPEGVSWNHDIYVTNELDVLDGSFDVDFHYFAFPTEESSVKVLEFSVETIIDESLMTNRINRKWNIQGTTEDDVICIFYWDPIDDLYFDWIGKQPSVYKGDLEFVDITFQISQEPEGEGKAGGQRSWVRVEIPADVFNEPGIYTIGVSDGGTLPVELSSFTASMNAYNHVTLQWVTQSETNVSGFRIYRHTEMDLSTATMLNMWVEATNTSQMQIYQVNDDEIYEEDTYYYWLENVDMDGSSAFHGPLSIQVQFSGISTPGIPIVQGINNSYPNPFNPTVTIRYGITNPGLAKLSVYNIKGQLVKELFSGQREVGNYSISWDGKDNNMRSTTSGTYFLRLDVSGKKYVKKIIQMK